MSTSWIKFAPRYLEFCLGVKKFAFELPKVPPDLAKYVKKHQKLLYCFDNLESDSPKLLNLCIEFAYSFGKTLGKSDSKKEN